MVMDILAKARKMPEAVHMEIGEPDLPPSPNVEEAFIRAARDKKFHYTPAMGLLALRERISQHYLSRYNVTVTPERILITPGTSGAFMVAFALLTGSGKTLLLSDPSYPCYKNFAYFLDTEPVMLPVGRETNYEITPEMLRDRADIGALVVSSPSNPVGNLYGEDTLRGLISLSDQKGTWFISDEIYHGLVYEKKERTALEFSDRAVVINSFSKYFCMPGFRIGWMIVPEELVRQAEIIVQNVFIAANTPSQCAAVEAFDDRHLNYVRDTFRERRDFLFAGLRDIFTIDAVPDGAFYIWADISRFSSDSVEFCNRLLEEQSVALTPGTDFGRNEVHKYVRFAYTQDIAGLRAGLERIRDFIKK